MNAELTVQVIRKAIQLIIIGSLISQFTIVNGEPYHPYYKFEQQVNPQQWFHQFFQRGFIPVQSQGPYIQHSSAGFHHQTVISPFGNGAPLPVHEGHVQRNLMPLFPNYGIVARPPTFWNIKPNREIDGEIKRQSSSAPETCFVSGKYGQCYKRNECIEKGGQALTYCPNFSYMCCFKSINSCNAKSQTDEIHVYFKNPRYPYLDVIKGKCGFPIKKRSEDICSLRVSIVFMELPSATNYGCSDIYFAVSGVVNKQYQPICGFLSGAVVDVDLTETQNVELFVNNDSPFSLRWDVHVTQIKCSEPPAEEWPLLDPSITTDAPPVITTGPTTITTENSMTTLAPPNLRCGVSPVVKKGTTILRNSNVRDRGQNPLQRQAFSKQDYDANQQETNQDDDDDDDDQPQDFSQFSLGDFSQFTLRDASLEWGVPTLTESDFYKYAGAPNQLTGRITYGKITEPHKYPWNVVLKRNNRYSCGGTLISNKHILTAAHCVERHSNFPSSFKITLGDWDLSTNTDGSKVERGVKQIIYHAQYSSRTIKNDIAILVLDKEVQFTKTLLPICLPSEDIPLDGKIVTVSGWGRNERNKLQSLLMEHSAAVVSTTECQRRWKAQGPITIYDTMLCMDAQDGDSCKGDSGGPTIMEYPKGSGKYIQVGIVSFGSASCTEAQLPGVYTKVTKYTKWIKDNMK